MKPETEEKTLLAKLLVIDDEPVAMKLVKTMLTRANYQVFSYDNANDALNTLMEPDGHEQFDCIITDAIMPQMSGYDFVKAVRRLPHFKEMPILMLTRKRHRQDVKKAVDAGVTDYVLKPIDEHLLLDKVELCLKKGLGKRHIFECQIHGSHSAATLELPAQVVALSEADLTFRSSIPLQADLEFYLRNVFFDEIGIKVPLLKLLKCERIEAVPPSKDPVYESKLSFIGVPESDLKKIRAWLQREEIRRRK